MLMLVGFVTTSYFHHVPGCNYYRSINFSIIDSQIRYFCVYKSAPFVVRDMLQMFDESRILTLTLSTACQEDM